MSKKNLTLLWLSLSALHLNHCYAVGPSKGSEEPNRKIWPGNESFPDPLDSKESQASSGWWNWLSAPYRLGAYILQPAKNLLTSGANLLNLWPSPVADPNLNPPDAGGSRANTEKAQSQFNHPIESSLTPNGGKKATPYPDLYNPLDPNFLPFKILQNPFFPTKTAEYGQELRLYPDLDKSFDPHFLPLPVFPTKTAEYGQELRLYPDLDKSFDPHFLPPPVFLTKTAEELADYAARLQATKAAREALEFLKERGSIYPSDGLLEEAAKAAVIASLDAIAASQNAPFTPSEYADELKAVAVDAILKFIEAEKADEAARREAIKKEQIVGTNKAFYKAIINIKPFLIDKPFTSEQERKIYRKVIEETIRPFLMGKKVKLMIEQGMWDSLAAEATKAAQEAAQEAVQDELERGAMTSLADRRKSDLELEAEQEAKAQAQADKAARREAIKKDQIVRTNKNLYKLVIRPFLTDESFPSEQERKIFRKVMEATIRPFLTDESFISEQGKKIFRNVIVAARKKAKLMIEQKSLESLEAEVTQAAQVALADE